MNIVSKNPVYLKPLINIGALMDIPTGTYITGMKDEKIINGGLSGVVGVIGRGNNFKSTIIHYLMLQADNRLSASKLDIPMHTYDTEDNMSLNVERFNSFANRFNYIKENPLYHPDLWSIVSKSEMSAEEWIKQVVDLAKKKESDAKNYIVYECFKNMITNKPLTLPKPNFIEIDSLSELEASSTIDTVEKDILHHNLKKLYSILK